MNWKKVDEMLNEYWKYIVANLDSCEECVCREHGTDCLASTCEENILRCWFEVNGEFEDGEED